MKIEFAKKLVVGQYVYHTVRKSSDGMPMKAEVTSVRTWDNQPERIEVHVVRFTPGLLDSAVFTENELHLITDEK